MTEEQMFEAMFAESRKVNKRYKDKWGGKIDKKFLEPEPAPKPKPKTTAAPPKSSSCRKISQDQIEDILYFQSKGWCVTSTAIFLGVSKSTVKRYRKRQG